MAKRPLNKADARATRPAKGRPCDRADAAPDSNSAPLRYPVAAGRPSPHEPEFREVVELIQTAKAQAYQAVNSALVDLYWQVGSFISRKVEEQGWGKGTVAALADYVREREPRTKGFSAPNLWRMKQFFESYCDKTKLSAPLRELTWTHNLLIMGKCKLPEEREFYVRMCIREKWSKRELEHQINACLFERQVLRPAKLAPAVRELYPFADQLLKDSYLLDFLDLPEPFDERELQKGLVANLKRFLLELGRDFCFIGEDYLIQIGSKDFRLDLLFFHRELRCLVAFELKIEDFKPADLGQLSFYLEALDRDVRKPHENPSVGILLCKGKDDEVVEYALSRTLSPAMVAEYQTKLPDRRLLQAKLHELLELAESAGAYGNR